MRRGGRGAVRLQEQRRRQLRAMKKRHEQLARSEFENWLRPRFPGEDMRWEEPPNSDPRPDWYLFLNHVQYAVEATSVVPTVTLGKSTVLEGSISAGIGDFIDDVQRRAEDEGILQGAYAIAIGPMPNHRATRRRITEGILQFIRRTRDLGMTDPVSIGRVGQYDVTIQKMHAGGNYLAETVDLGIRSDAEVAEDFRLQLRSSVERKASRYAGFRSPVILLILDGFHIVDASEWLSAPASIEAISVFDAVFRIKPANPPLLMASRGSIWRLLSDGNQQIAE